MIDETTETLEKREEMARVAAENRRWREVLGRLAVTLGLLEQTGFIETYEDEEGVREGIEVLKRMVEDWRERHVIRAVLLSKRR
jgi:hypothetical protein